MLVHMGSCACGDQRSTAGVFLCHPPSCSLRQGLSLVCNSSSRLGWLFSKPQGSTFLCLPSTGIITARYHTGHFYFFGSRNQIKVLMFAQPTLCHLSLSPDSFLLLSVQFPTPTHPVGNPNSRRAVQVRCRLWGNVELTIPSLWHIPKQIL